MTQCQRNIQVAERIFIAFIFLVAARSSGLTNSGVTSVAVVTRRDGAVSESYDQSEVNKK